jgi:hypothetical protein
MARATETPVVQPAPSDSRDRCQHRSHNDPIASVALRGLVAGDRDGDASQTRSREQHGGRGQPAGSAKPCDGGGEEGDAPGTERGELPGVHRVADDQRHGAAVAEHRAKIEQGTGCGYTAGRGARHDRRGNQEGHGRGGRAEEKRRLWPGQSVAETGDGEGHGAGDATPAACQDTARDCAGPSKGSAIAFRPGI